jgi:Protein of unknown function (DUF3800)
MYAYVDESGNTGFRIFDPDQPLFITAAIMTKTNFDAIRKGELAAISRKVKVTALHANELGVARIEEIADDLLRLVKKADARFFVSRVEKMYLAAAKIFDTYFDQRENMAVPWHLYWIRPLRLMLMFKLAQYVITEDIAVTVWNCVTAPSEQKSKAFFIKGATDMLANAQRLPDERSRRVVTEALEWALANPDNFSTHIRDKVNRNAHSPDFVGFANLMDGMHRASKDWKSPVREIVHDQQSQFERTLSQWHEVFSRPSLADEEPHYWPGEEEPLSLSKTPGSKLRMATEETSPGLQVIDVVLWLFKRTVTDKDIGPRGARLLQRVLEKGRQNDLSFDGVSNAVEGKLEEIYAEPVTDEQQRAGEKLSAEFEASRIKAMKDYVAQKAREA